MAKTTYQPGYFSPETAILALKSAGLLQDVRFPDQALRRLLAAGAVEGIAPRANYPKEGWEVSAESLDDYIRIQKMNAEELRLELLGVKRLRIELEQERMLREEAVKRADSLARKLKKYEPEEKKPKGTQTRKKDDTAKAFQSAPGSYMAELTERKAADGGNQIENEKTDA